MLSSPRIIFERHWFREQKNRRIDTDLFEEIDHRFSIEGLGLDTAIGEKAADRRVAANRAAVRVGQAAYLNGAVPVELHLPCVDRRGADAFAARGADTPARILPDGAVLLQDPDLYQAHLLASVALNSYEPAASPTVPFYLRFADRRSCSQIVALHQLPPVLTRYNLPREALCWIANRNGESFDISVLLRVHSSAVGTWGTVAGPRQAAFHDQFQPVAQAIQEGLRLWLPYLFFQDDKRFDAPRKAWPLLLYALMKPFRSEFKADYTYDPTDEVSIQKALWGVGPLLEAEMKRLSPRLVALGLPTPLQFQFSQRRTPQMAKVAKSTRLFGSLLYGEQQIMESIVAFASEIHKGLRNSIPVSPVKMGTLFHRKLHKQLKRICGTFDATALLSMILVESTSALAWAQHRPSPVEALIRIRARQEGSEYYAVNSVFQG